MITKLFSWLQWESGEFWPGSQVMWKGRECLPITPSHLHKIKSQLSSVIHKVDDYNNKWEKCNHMKLILYLQKREKI